VNTIPSGQPDDRDRQFDQAIAEFGPALARLAFAYEPDADRRSDLVQEIHFALWRSLATFDGRCSLRTWIYRVGHNTATEHVFRRRGRNPATFESLEEIEARPSVVDVEAATDRDRSLERLLGLIQRLAPLDRQLMTAYLEDLSAEEIADITGLSVSNVWTRIHRIKSLLKRQFHEGVSHGR
jgi:RNA polymerase sigma-70 factor (ECF subfamily)